jgi:DNA-binding protein HU-beta
LRLLAARGDIRRPSRLKETSVNKQELIGVVARRLDVTRARASEIADLFFAAEGVIASELKRGGKVVISGFGSFELRRRAAREGKNPRTGKAMSIRGSLAPAFRAGRALKEVVNRKR